MSQILEQMFLNYPSLTTKKNRLTLLNNTLKMVMSNDYPSVKQNPICDDMCSYIDVLAFRVLIGMIDLLQGDVGTTILYFSNNIFKEPQDACLSLAKGMAHLENAKRKYDEKECRKAQTYFNDAMRMCENDQIREYANYQLAVSHYYLGRFVDNNSNENYETALNKLDEVISFYKLKAKDNPKENSHFKQFLLEPLNSKGNTLIKLQNISKAKSAFEEALSIEPDYAQAHNGLGNLYRHDQNVYEAIRSYNKAIEVDPEFVYPWNYLGDCFRFIEEHAIALKCYNRAIEINYNIGFPHYGLGRTYYELGNRNSNLEYYDEALKHLEVALSIFNFKYAHLDKARVFEKLNQYDVAIKHYRDAKGLFKNSYRKQTITDNINKLDALIRINTTKVNFNPNGGSLHKYVISKTMDDSLENLIISNKRRFLTTFLKEQTQRKKDAFLNKLIWEKNKGLKNSKNKDLLLDFINKDRHNFNKPSSSLQILRRWNSYTPIIGDSSKGGGYFIQTKSDGIVLDPGFDFIKNFKLYNNVFADINYIFVSHSHDDHTADLESILNLLYRFNKELEDNTIPRELAKEQGLDTITVRRTQNKMVVDRFNTRKKVLNFYISSGVYIKYSGLFNSDQNKFRQLKPNEIKLSKFEKVTCGIKELKSGSSFKLIDNSIALHSEIITHVLKANHNDLIPDQDCLGFAFELEEAFVVYTGDTGWYNKDGESLTQQYKNLKLSARNKKKSIILLAHLGGFEEDEKLILDPQEKLAENKLAYDNHLGRIGLVRLVEALEPNICLISEFGEEFNGYRIILTEIFRESFKLSKKFTTCFLPADYGLLIDLSKSPKVRVITEIDNTNKKIVYSFIEPQKVEIGEYRQKNSLFYFEKKHSLSESACIQAFLDGFESTYHELP